MEKVERRLAALGVLSLAIHHYHHPKPEHAA